MATRQERKAAKRQEEKDRRPKAVAKYVRISSRKVKAVIDLIRGLAGGRRKRRFDEYAKQAQQSPSAKVLNSAIANGRNQHEPLGRYAVRRRSFSQTRAYAQAVRTPCSGQGVAHP